MKKNIYLAQINYMHGKSTFLPYAVGTLIAAAKSNKEIDGYYSFEQPFFIREDIDNIINQIENPFLFGFSNYIWNHEFNKKLAKRIKEKYPDCIILFGGHQITPDETLLVNEDYIDIMISGEGEEVFEKLLLALKNNSSLKNVPNIYYRENKSIKFSFSKKIERIDFPSPYLTGVFDSILKSQSSIDFLAIIETNRGCPYNCSYCDWGNLHSNIRFFSDERIIKELKWLSDHNIKGFGCADANFGMFERDELIVDEMIRLHKKNGILSNFQVSYAKNSNERTFRITKKLNDCGMNKGATLSFQSLNPDVLKNIHRTNITVESFTSLLNKYNESGIATYSELIIGLPGETLESFIDGIDILLNSGQHNSIYIHNCEWLPCSAMGNSNYIEKYGINYVVVPLNESHTSLECNDSIQEYSRIIVETNTMSREDWVKTNIYSTAIQCFHHEGLLILFALYLHEKQKLDYSSFYSSFINFIFSNTNSVAGSIFKKIKNRFDEVSQGNNSLVFEDNRFGNIGWSAEEFAFLNIAIQIDNFYLEIKDFLSSFFEDPELFEELFLYQKNILKLPTAKELLFHSKYNFKQFFEDLLCAKESSLQKVDCTNTISEPITYSSWEDYARCIVWYGRKDTRNIYINEINVTYND